MVLINGISGAGKTSLARDLAPMLGLPLFSQDDFKETFFDFGPDGIPAKALGMLAIEALWTAATAVPASIIESNWHRERDREFAIAGLQRANLEVVVEIYCRVDVDVALARAASRARHPVHSGDQFTMAHWRRLAEGAIPIELSPVLELDTSQQIDLPKLVQAVRALF